MTSEKGRRRWLCQRHTCPNCVVVMESDVAAKAASLLSRGAAADYSPGASGFVVQLQFKMMCERPPRSLRSRLPLTRGRLRHRRQGSLTHHLELELVNTPVSLGPHSAAAPRL